MENEIKIPCHIGIIMDGNGRWAKIRGKKRSYGHKKGAENLEKLSQYILKKVGVKVLSIYVFSTENFKREQEEVDYLMNLIVEEFRKNAKNYIRENIKVVFSGRREPLKPEVLQVIDDLSMQTKNNTGGILNVCLNYGSHMEIIDATLKIHQDLEQKKISIKEINEELFATYLYQNLPPIDFLIRTSGEYRISNFMLWQASYAEFYFPEVYFPDFDESEFDKALLEYTNRERRFGGIDYEKKNH